MASLALGLFRSVFLKISKYLGDSSNILLFLTSSLIFHGHKTYFIRILLFKNILSLFYVPEYTLLSKCFVFIWKKKFIQWLLGRIFYKYQLDQVSW